MNAVMDLMSRMPGPAFRDRNSFAVVDKFSVSKMDELEAQRREPNAQAHVNSMIIRKSIIIM